MLSTVVGGLAMGYLCNAIAPDPTSYLAMPAWEHLIMGGFAFGAVFMATDPVTSAQTETGKWIYGFLIGAFTIILRVFNPGYPEGMMLSILLMNTFAPLIDYCVVQRNSSAEEHQEPSQKGTNQSIRYSTMNTNSNTYTVIYSIILVVVVAAVLAFVSVSLSDRQNANVATETRQSILYSVNLAQEADQAKDKNSYIEAEYNKYITDSYLVNVKGDKVEGEAFPMALASGLKSQYDIMKQANPDVSKLTLPVFVCTLDDGSRVEIFPIYGAGLWGPIWGVSVPR